MKQKAIIKTGILWLVAAAVLLIGINRLVINGILGQRAIQAAAWKMWAEMILFFCYLLFFLSRKKSPVLRIGGTILTVLVFVWCHQAFLPLLISGIYLLYLILLGNRLRSCFGKDTSCCSFASDFLLGSSVWITLVCVLSALNYGGISVLRLVAVLTAIPIFLSAILPKLRWYLTHKETSHRMLSAMIGHGLDWIQALSAAFILLLLLLQVGRMNVAMDYDSLHYGLRTPYILNNGLGIYENLGNVNLVYTYSKGLETLVMPLSGTATYGYVLSFNIWITIWILVMIYQIVKKFAGHRYGLLAAAITASIPGIMNMGITAKSDSITLLFQLFLVYFMLCYLERENKEHKAVYLIIATSAYLFTFMLKPTALVFSTVIYGIGILYLIITHNLYMKKTRSLYFMVPCLCGVAGIWARTLILTGFPVTSVFTSIFHCLGFKVKLPFAFSEVPSNGGSPFSKEGMVHLLKRLFNILTSPTGADMDHVILAWGTGLVVVLLTAMLLFRRKSDYHDKRETYLYAIFIALSIVSLVSIYLLWQVDGNYFMLFYALLVVLGVLAIYRAVEVWKLKAKPIGWILVLLMLFNLFVTGLTNWSGYIGFSPIRWAHKGYYDHLKEAWQDKADTGNVGIWNILAADPKTRVIAIGNHPDVLTFPCNVQSYYDVTGSGGNVVVVKYLDYFKDFLRYAKTEYIYVQADYLKQGTRVSDIVTYMMEDGSLSDIVYENGNMLGRVKLKRKGS